MSTGRHMETEIMTRPLLVIFLELFASLSSLIAPAFNLEYTALIMCIGLYI